MSYKGQNAMPTPLGSTRSKEPSVQAKHLLPYRRAFSTQTLLAVLVAAFLVPVVILASLLLGRFAEGERSRQQGDALDIARQLATEVDRELSGLQSAAQVLTTYRSIDTRDYPTLYAQATEVKRFLGVEVVLKDPSGQQIVNTRLPWGMPLPVSLSEADKLALETKKPVISDLFTSATAQRPIVSINAPVLRNGEAVALVNMMVDPARLGQVLRSRGLPDQWISALVDRNGKIIARSRQHDQFVGQTATADLRENAIGLEGTWIGTTLEGTSVLSAYARTALSNWRVAVGAPVAAVEAPLRQSLLWLIGLGGTTLALSTLIAGWCGRQIARSMRSLAQAASSLSGAEAMQLPHTRLREVNAIGDALVAASLDLRQRTEARDQAEGKLRAESERLEILNRTGEAIASELDLQKLVQKVTDAGVALTGARFGAFFYNVTDAGGETLTLYSISGVPREEFSKFPMPRPTAVFHPTFSGEGIVRSDDILQDPRYGKNQPYRGMPDGHLPVRSYLAVPVISRSGEVLGGLFFGHAEPGMFKPEHESLLSGIAGQAAIAIDNARLLQDAQRELEERGRSEEGLRESEERLRLALEAGRLGSWELDIASSRRLLSPRSAEIFGVPTDELLDREAWQAVIHPGDRERLNTTFQAALQGRAPYRAEFRVLAKDGGVRWVSSQAIVHRDRSGAPQRVVGIHQDITERKSWEEHQSLLINELNHRVKNTLATVQSLAGQTLRNASSMEQVREDLEGRLFALSRIHDVLTRESWNGANLREVVQQAIEPYRRADDDRFHVAGEDTRLSPQMALAMALALQELATNAVKYGALSNATGVVRITWKITCAASDRRLMLRWDEAGGPTVDPPTRCGFGSRLIERSFAMELGGQARLEFHPDGVSCTVDAPVN
jgi:PAS domain S-box-containing protein